MKKKTEVTNDFMIVPNKGHYVVFINGEFFETADTQEEALRDVKEHFNNIKED